MGAWHTLSERARSRVTTSSALPWSATCFIQHKIATQKKKTDQACSFSHDPVREARGQISTHGLAHRTSRCGLDGLSSLMVRGHFAGLGIGDADIPGVLKENTQFRSEKTFCLKLIVGLVHRQV